MNPEISTLQPQSLWRNFARLNEVPRASKKEARVIAYMKAFGEGLNLETLVDDVGNVIIKKPATAGMENRKTVVLQSHLDMVHQKNNDTVFDFDTQGIDMFVDGDWVKAKGTTLGADNGIGVATIMAILERTDLPHPALEALFTIDEETGMTGALGLKRGMLKGEILLNLDTEEDDEIGVGCAGGIDVTATRTYREIDTPPHKTAYRILVNGLKGGHSGMDIHKGLGNANKLLFRLLHIASKDFGMRISEVDGGGLRNAIPREARAIVVVDPERSSDFEHWLEQHIADIKKEYNTMEPSLKITLKTCAIPSKIMSPEVQSQLINVLNTTWNGVYRMSPDIPDLVETSNNLAKVLVQNGRVNIACLTRSSVESSKMDLANVLKSGFDLAGCAVEFSGSYPGWTPNMDSAILKVVEQLYEELNQDKPRIAACHAGLECGILGTHYPEMDMVSFGPNIRGAHAPDERVQISSVQKFWKFVQEILKRIPEA